MWDLETAVIVTNNDRVFEKYQNKTNVVLLHTYEEVLIKVRDMVYDRHILLTHPQASSLKPNQTPYRSVMVYPKGESDNTKDVLLIEKCIETFHQWQEIACTPKDYDTGVSDDFKTIDLSVIDHVMSRVS